MNLIRIENLHDTFVEGFKKIWWVVQKWLCSSCKFDPNWASDMPRTLRVLGSMRITRQHSFFVMTNAHTWNSMNDEALAYFYHEYSGCNLEDVWCLGQGSLTLDVNAKKFYWQFLQEFITKQGVITNLPKENSLGYLFACARSTPFSSICLGSHLACKTSLVLCSVAYSPWPLTATVDTLHLRECL